jgi:hypothetical protein
MNVFAKIFAQIFDSSIAEDHMVRYVFMDLLVLADREGVVDMTQQAISRRTNVPEDIVNHAISTLTKPDTRSRSDLEGGARIVLLDSHRDWGWQIVNYEHYRHIRDEESRKAYFRDKKREYRSTHKSTNSPTVSTLSTQMSNGVLDMSNNVLDSPHLSTKGEGELEVKEQKPSRKRATKIGESDQRHAEFKEAIRVYWDSKNKGVDMPWGPMEGKQLGMWLREAPHIDLEQFKGFLRGRYLSAVNHGERPAQWIRWVTSYTVPVDRFNKPQEGNGNGSMARKTRSDHNAEALAEAKRLIGADGNNGGSY